VFGFFEVRTLNQELSGRVMACKGEVNAKCSDISGSLGGKREDGGLSCGLLRLVVW
jgi:hypothetical protein